MIDAITRYPANLSVNESSADLTQKDEAVLQEAKKDFLLASTARSNLFKDAETLGAAQTGDQLNAAMAPFCLPSVFRPYMNIGVMDHLRASALEVTEFVISPRTLTKETVDQLKGFWHRYRGIQAKITAYQLDKLLVREPEDSEPAVLLVSADDSLVTAARDPKIGWKTVIYSTAPFDILREGGFSTLLESAGLSQPALDVFPAWEDFHERRKQLSKSLPAALNICDSQKNSSESVQPALDSIQTLYGAALTVLSNPDDAKVARAVQGMNRGAIEIPKITMMPHLQLEQIFNMQHIDSMYQFLTQLQASSKPSRKASDFTQLYNDKMSGLSNAKGTFYDTWVDSVDRIKQDPFDGKAWIMASLVNEATSKWMGKGLKNLLHDAEDKDSMMSEAREQVKVHHPDTWQDDIDALPEALRGSMLHTSVSQCQGVMEALEV